MKHISIIVIGILMGLGLTSCASSDEDTAHVQVLPSEYGLHRVVSKDMDKYVAESAAVDAAKDYCLNREQEAVFGGSVGATSRYLSYTESSNREQVANITFRCR